LYSGDGTTAVDVKPSIDGTPQGHMYGVLVAQLKKLRDMNGKQCLLFIFSDVSIRCQGEYQLGISVMRIAKYHVFFNGTI
jgi:hypothetical protein